MPKAYISRKEEFAAAHRLYNATLTDAENLYLFDKCFTLHGHNYQLEVVLYGDIDQLTGYVYDLKQLKHIVHETILARFDHQYLNELDEFHDIIPTAENIAMVIFNTLKQTAIGNILDKIILHETSKHSVTYTGDSINV